MKKLLYLVAFVVAVTFAACGNKSEKSGDTAAEQEMSAFEQGFVEGFIEGMDEELSGIAEEGMQYSGTVVDGKRFICTFTVDESLFGGLSMRQAFQYVGMTEEVFAQTMKTEMQKSMTEQEAELMSTLSQLKYDLVFRLVGSESGEEMNCKIGHEEFAR